MAIGEKITTSGGTVTAVTATAPLASSGGTTPNISLTGNVVAWTVKTTNAALAARTGYFDNSVGGLTFTLPSTSSIGDIYQVAAMNTGLFTIAQNASQSIIFNANATTSGAGGSIALTSTGGAISIICNVANTGFQVLTSLGEFTTT